MQRISDVATGNQGNKGNVRKIENDQKNQGKVRELCKTLLEN